MGTTCGGITGLIPILLICKADQQKTSFSKRTEVEARKLNFREQL